MHPSPKTRREPWHQAFIEHGWVSIDVPELGFLYTIGFPSRFGIPEVCVAGFSTGLRSSAVSALADFLTKGNCVEDEEAFVGLGRSPDSDYLPHYMLRRIAHESVLNHFGIMCRCYGKEISKVIVWQLFVTDAKDLFPWDEGADMQYHSEQVKFAQFLQ